MERDSWVCVSHSYREFAIATYNPQIFRTVQDGCADLLLTRDIWLALRRRVGVGGAHVDFLR